MDYDGSTGKLLVTGMSTVQAQEVTPDEVGYIVK